MSTTRWQLGIDGERRIVRVRHSCGREAHLMDTEPDEPLRWRCDRCDVEVGHEEAKRALAGREALPVGWRQL